MTGSVQVIIGLGAIQALAMLAGLARAKVLALLLGPEGVGIASVIDQVVGLVTHLGSLSIPLAALRFLSKRSDSLAALTELFGALLRLILVGCLLATGLAMGLAVWQTSLLAAELEAYRLPLVVGLVAAPPVALGAMLRNTLATLSRHREAALSALLGAILMVVSSYVGVRLGGLTGLYVGNLIVHSLIVGVMLTYLARSTGVTARLWVRRPFAAIGEEPGLARFCTVIHLLSLSSPVAYLAARVSMLAHHGAATSGLFFSAYGLAIAMRVVLNQANSLYLTPILNRSTPKIERATRAASYTHGLLALLLLGASAPILFPELFLTALYSREFLEARHFLGWFVLSEAILVVAGVYQALLIGFGDLRAHSYISLLGNTVVFAGSLLLIPSMGPTGAAVAFGIGQGIMLTLSWGALVVGHGAKPLLRTVVPTLAVLGALAAGATLVAQGDAGVGVRVAALSLAVAGSLFVMTREERHALLSRFRGRRH